MRIHSPYFPIIAWVLFVPSALAAQQQSPVAPGHWTAAFGQPLPSPTGTDTSWIGTITDFAGSAIIIMKYRTKRRPGQASPALVTHDSLQVAFDSGWVVVPNCSRDSAASADPIVGLVSTYDRDSVIALVVNAWELSMRKRQIVPISPGGLRCKNPFLQ